MTTIYVGFGERDEEDEREFLFVTLDITKASDMLDKLATYYVDRTKINSVTWRVGGYRTLYVQEFYE